MSAGACRKDLENVARDKGEHVGLMLSRYLQIRVQDAEKKHPAERCALYKAAIDAAKAAESVYKPAYERHCQHLQQAQPYKGEDFAVEGRLIVGLGGENVLETGITLHHTYGVPIIPGSALKGLASHYCDQIWGNEETYVENSATRIEAHKFKLGGEWHRAIFGVTDDSGHIIFHDAWSTPGSLKGDGKHGIILDVMTPHHGDYYVGKDTTGRLFPAPTDFDDPNPVTFLSVTGVFHVAISCGVAGGEGEKWVKLASQLLTEALDHWGVGGKTNAGYGRLKKEPKPDGPPPKTKPDEQAVWLKEMSEDGKFTFVTQEGKEVSCNVVQGVGKKNPLTIGKWCVFSGSKSVKLPGK